MNVRLRRAGLPVVAIAAGALALSACGSSSSTPAASTSGAATSGDQVTALTHLTGESTSVILDPDTLAALKSLHVSLGLIGKATLSGSTVSFPITSGYAEIHSDHSVKPGWIQGSIQHDTSGFSLKAGSTEVDLSNFVVDPGGSMLYGTVNGTTANVPLLFLDGTNVKPTISDSTVTLDGTVAKLTSTAAAALNKAFGVTAFTAGLKLGTVHLVANKTNAATFAASTASNVPLLAGVSTNVAVNTGTLTALKGLGVSVGTTGTASLANGTLSFPITGGFVGIHSDKSFKPGYIVGSIAHEGSGLSFTAGSKRLVVEDFAVDPGNSVLNAYVPALKAVVPLLFLDGSKVKVSMADGNYVLDGTVAELTKEAAGALNSFFGTDKLTAGIPIGVVHLVAKPA